MKGETGDGKAGMNTTTTTTTTTNTAPLGTLEVMLKNGGLRLNELRVVVVDEVDACADMSERGAALQSKPGPCL